MTSTQRFIEDAFEGGWEYRGAKKQHGITVAQASLDDDWHIYAKEIKQNEPLYRVVTERIMLDPSAWAAVAKARKIHIHHRYAMISFINKIVNGSTIEAALSDIEGTKNTPLQ